MPLTPIDIQQKTFGPELRGYNMDEVDDFLDDVVTTLKDYDQRVRDAQDRIRALEAEVASRGEDETAISRALVAAQKQADALIAEAREDAERIRGDAFDETDRLRADQDAERMALTQEIARMRATVADLKRRVVELANSAGNDLDAMDAAIAEASAAVAGPLTADTAEVEAYEEQQEFEDDAASEIGDWGESSEEFTEPEAEWEQPAAVDLAENEADWQDDEVTSELPGYEEPEAVADDQLESEDLADEMADEASSRGEHLGEEAPAPSRRPWERGSV
jgi:cell division initiation protein